MNSKEEKTPLSPSRLTDTKTRPAWIRSGFDNLP